jgi:CheY-like chemotaxis protein
VRLAVTRDPSGVVFRVQDEGPGFRAGARAVAVRSGLAPGLGMRIVDTLAERVGGEIELSNRPGGGAEAVLRLPPETAVDVPPAEAGAPDLRGLRILLAEDNLTNQLVATQMLQALNAEVIVCSDGLEALERFEARAVDLVVVDIEMPRMSGLDVIRAIRARGDARARVPIVALTAYAMREHRERIVAVGANGLISKPVTSVAALGQGLAAFLPRGWTGRSAATERGADGLDGIIDLSTYAALCDAIGPEMMAELLDKVASDLVGAQRDLARAIDPLDRGVIRSASHILISVAGALGAVRLQAGARALNAGCLAEAPEPLEIAVRGCMAEIDRAVAFARDRRAEM